MVNTLQVALIVAYLCIQVSCLPHPACQMLIVYELVLVLANSAS